MKPKFKKGDRVRFIGECEEQGVSYNEFTLIEDSDDKHTVVVQYCKEELCFDNDELELVEPFDKKTSFLTELKELLTRYDADITMGFCAKDRVAGVIFEVDNQQLYYPAKIEEEDPDPSIIYQRLKTNYPITPSNIFDYDKGES